MFILLLYTCQAHLRSNQRLIQSDTIPSTSSGKLAEGLKTLNQELSDFSYKLNSALKELDQKLDANIEVNADTGVALIDNEIAILTNRKEDLQEELDELSEENQQIEDDCEELVSCSDCLEDSNCVWCNQTESCVAGTENGPVYSECEDFSYDTCEDYNSTDKSTSVLENNLDEKNELKQEISETQNAIESLESNKQDIIYRAANGKSQDLEQVAIDNQLDGIVEEVESLYNQEEMHQQMFEKKLASDTADELVIEIDSGLDNSTLEIESEFENRTETELDELDEFEFEEAEKVNEINHKIVNVEENVGMCIGDESGVVESQVSETDEAGQGVSGSESGGSGAGEGSDVDQSSLSVPASGEVSGGSGLSSGSGVVSGGSGEVSDVSSYGSESGDSAVPNTDAQIVSGQGSNTDVPV